MANMVKLGTKEVIIMSQRLKNILEGFGSVLNIAPSTNYKKYIPSRDYSNRLERRWFRVGNHIRKAINRFEYEQKDEKRSTA
jgi:hypothetical protein